MSLPDALPAALQEHEFHGAVLLRNDQDRGAQRSDVRGRADQGQTLRDRVLAVVTAATKQMPADHRDRRYYTDDNKTELNNVGVIPT